MTSPFRAALGACVAAIFLASSAFADTERLRGTIGSPVSPSAQIITVISNNIGEVDPDITI